MFGENMKIREGGFAIDRLFFARPTQGERFHLQVLLTTNAKT